MNFRNIPSAFSDSYAITGGRKCCKIYLKIKKILIKILTGISLFFLSEKKYFRPKNFFLIWEYQRYNLQSLNPAKFPTARNGFFQRSTTFLKQSVFKYFFLCDQRSRLKRVSLTVPKIVIFESVCYLRSVPPGSNVWLASSIKETRTNARSFLSFLFLYYWLRWLGRPL